MSNEFNELRNLVKTGASIMSAIEADEHRNKLNKLDQEARDIEEDKRRQAENEAAYNRGLKANKSGDDRFQLKEMTCPNCGATMKPDELANRTAALGSVDCPYCGSKIVLNDEVKNAEYVHKVDVEKKRTQLEERKVKLEEDRMKAQREHEDSRSAIDTIDAVDRGISKAIKIGGMAIGCFSIAIIAIILIIVLVIVFRFLK